jgi:uncharacterized protein (TIGR03000 family)
MSRKLLHLVPVLAAVGSLVVLAGAAVAGPTSGGHSHGTGYSGQSSGYYYAPAYVTPAYLAPAAPVASGAFYYSPDSSATGADSAAQLNVQVPANAEVWLNGYKTKLTGSARTFISPPLTNDQNYRYHVRVRWMENGQPVTQERDVPVAPGTQTSVQFAGLSR